VVKPVTIVLRRLNPADHLCVAGQLLITQTAGHTWTLSGAIHAVKQHR
jgi:hypothetical protein